MDFLMIVTAIPMTLDPRGNKRNPRRRYYQERGGRPPDREGDKD